jgi:hypothetical protein
MRPCPTCGNDQPDFAATCTDCGGALAPPTGATAIDPMPEMRATLHARDEALAAATTSLADLKRESEKAVADLRQRADTLAAENEKLRATPPPPPRPAEETKTGESSSGVWGSAALIGLLKKWPRVAAASTAVMALGTAYSGFDLGKGAIQGTPPTQTVAVSGSLDASEAVKERDDLRQQVSSLENQLGAATKEVAAATIARDQALAREKTALTRPGIAAGAPPRPLAASGFVDFIVPRGANNSEIAVQRGRSLLLAGGTWPTGECTMVAGDPEARFQGTPFESVGNGRRTLVIPGMCNAAQIVVRKSQDWDDGDIVRLFWQLRER